MPPKIRITKQMILRSAFALVQEEGHEALNVRRIAQRLGCSTQPVLYNFKTVDALRAEVYAAADAFHTNWLLSGLDASPEPLLTLGLNYVRFAHEQRQLFRFLFQTDQFSGMDVTALIGNAALSGMLDIAAPALQCSMERVKRAFLTLFIAAHGYASLLANNAMQYDEKQVEGVLRAVFDAAAHCTEPDAPAQDAPPAENKQK